MDARFDKVAEIEEEELRVLLMNILSSWEEKLIKDFGDATEDHLEQVGLLTDTNLTDEDLNLL